MLLGTWITCKQLCSPSLCSSRVRYIDLCFFKWVLYVLYGHFSFPCCPMHPCCCPQIFIIAGRPGSQKGRRVLFLLIRFPYSTRECSSSQFFSLRKKSSSLQSYCTLPLLLAHISPPSKFCYFPPKKESFRQPQSKSVEWPPFHFKAVFWSRGRGSKDPSTSFTGLWVFQYISLWRLTDKKNKN